MFDKGGGRIVLMVFVSVHNIALSLVIEDLLGPCAFYVQIGEFSLSDLRIIEVSTRCGRAPSVYVAEFPRFQSRFYSWGIVRLSYLPIGVTFMRPPIRVLSLSVFSPSSTMIRLHFDANRCIRMRIAAVIERVLSP